MEYSTADISIFSELLYDTVGITLTKKNHTSVIHKFTPRLLHHRLKTLAQYMQLVEQDADEHQIMIDLATTNETFFFREKTHFEYIATHIKERAKNPAPLKIWSVACSSGEEAYSLAMTCANQLGIAGDWRIFGTDINASVITKALKGIYLMDRLADMPREYLQQYCLKGVGPQEGYMAITPGLKQKVSFQRMNLLQPSQITDQFDFLLVRNLLIYFDTPTRNKVLTRIERFLRPGGYLITGLSESMIPMPPGFEKIKPSIYQKG